MFCSQVRTKLHIILEVFDKFLAKKGRKITCCSGGGGASGENSDFYLIVSIWTFCLGELLEFGEFWMLWERSPVSKSGTVHIHVIDGHGRTP